ncbi:MAG: tripartite tricarboxylate transporter permease [Moraxellaceae bacterium]|nr:tripartite tricarboxylate transporter permease [Moraxellaceae bacterium]
MGDLVANLSLGFGAAVTPGNLMFCFLGTLLGTLVGVLPGLGPITTIALLMPFAFSLEPVTALIMLAGVFYGSQYGGSTSAILTNIPGESASVITCLDGHPMARQGRAGAALAVAAWGSFIAGTVATLLIAVAAPLMAAVALAMTSVEYCALMLFGLVATVVLASGSVLNAICMIMVGLLLGLVGTDVNSGTQRYVFGVPLLADGLDFVALATGLFGITEVIQTMIAARSPAAERTGEVKSVGLTGEEWRRSWKAILRGTGLGSLLGILPGSGGTIASFASYALEKRVSKRPEEFGKGAIEGVAAPEAANNAGSQTSFVPLLTLGIPTNATMAVLSGAMIVHGIQPGPKVISEQPTLFWGLICSMWIGNFMLLLINLPLAKLWARGMEIPQRILAPAIVSICCVGVYAVTNSFAALAIMAGFGVVGFVLRRLDCEPAPLVLGFVLGPLLEENFRRAMMVAKGDLGVFVSRPISLALLIATALVLLSLSLPLVRRERSLLKECEA